MFRLTLLAVAATSAAAQNRKPASFGQPAPVIGFSFMDGVFKTNVVSDPVTARDVAQKFEFQDGTSPKALVVLYADGLKPYNAAEMLGETMSSVLSQEDSSTLSLPYTYAAGGSISTVLDGLFSLSGTTSNTVYVDAETVTFDSDKFEVQTGSPQDVAGVLEAATEESPARLLVNMKGDFQWSTIEHVRDAVGTDFVAFIVPSDYDTIRDTDSVADRRRLASAEIMGAVRMTPNIMLGLLTSVVLFFFLYIGFSSMMDIRENDRHWKNENVPLGAKVEM